MIYFRLCGGYCNYHMIAAIDVIHRIWLRPWLCSLIDSGRGTYLLFSIGFQVGVLCFVFQAISVQVVRFRSRFWFSNDGRPCPFVDQMEPPRNKAHSSGSYFGNFLGRLNKIFTLVALNYFFENFFRNGTHVNHMPSTHVKWENNWFLVVSFSHFFWFQSAPTSISIWSQSI